MAKDVPVNAVKISLELVDLLRELDGAGVSEVAKRLDKPTSTIHDHLRTLEQQEYLVKEGDTYYVSTRFLQLGAHARSRQKVFNIARPEIKRTRAGDRRARESDDRGTRYRRLSVPLAGPDAVRLDTHAGMRVPLQTTALGKSIMANRPREEVEGILDRHGLEAVTDRSITDREELFDVLEQVRERGYSYDDEERVKGMRCVAAPILNEDDYAIAAVSVSGPKSRMREERFTEELPNQILKSANVIEVNLTYS